MKTKTRNEDRLIGLLSGTVNGLLGAGGGMLIVPALKKETEIKKAHATTVAVIMPMCIVSSILYITSGRVTLSDALPYAPFGIIGSWIVKDTFPRVLCINSSLLSGSLPVCSAEPKDAS